MKRKLITVILTAVCAISLVACSGKGNATAETSVGTTASVDSVSKASTIYYYEATSWDKTKVIDSITNTVSDVAAVVISTVNEDGSPNAATIVPGIAGENELMFIFGSEGSTFKNIKEREIAVLTVFDHIPEEEVKNQGARVVLKAITDEAKIKELVEKNSLDEKTAAVTIFTEIVKVVPLG